MLVKPWVACKANPAVDMVVYIIILSKIWRKIKQNLFLVNLMQTSHKGGGGHPRAKLDYSETLGVI